MQLRFAIALALGEAIALGQMNTGEIAGSVQDPSGAVLPDATLIAEQGETGQKFTAISNGSGEYLFGLLPVGVYSITASAPNFKRSALSKIEIHAGERLRYDFTLQVGDAVEELTVQGDAVGLQLDTAEIKQVIGRQQVLALPLKGRQFLDLAMLIFPSCVMPSGTAGNLRSGRRRPGERNDYRLLR